MLVMYVLRLIHVSYDMNKERIYITLEYQIQSLPGIKELPYIICQFQ